MQGTIRSMVIALVALFVIAIIIQIITSSGNTAVVTYTPGPPPPTIVNPTRPPSQDVELEVNAQNVAATNSVVIAKVYAKVPGWVSIHLDNKGIPIQGNIGYVAVKPGLATNLTVKLRTTKISFNLWAMLHADAGKPGVFEFPGKDQVLNNTRGKVMRISFRANQ